MSIPEKPGKQQVEKIVNFIESQKETKLFHCDKGEPYARFSWKGVSEISQIRSRGFKRLISHISYREFGQAISKDALDKVLDIFEAKAIHDGTEYKLSVRVAHQDGKYFYDLLGAVVEISKDGWAILNDPPVLFKKYSVMKPQVIPTPGGNLDSLFDLINVTDKDSQLLVKVFIVASFIPDFAHPALIIYGQQGTAKSSFVRTLVSIIDPAATYDIEIFDVKEMIQAVSHRWLAPFDNLDRIPTRYSNLFCKIITGGGHSKRQLYTDDDDVIYQFKRIVVLNGINIPADKPDLLDRSIIIELEPIKKENRRTEKELNEHFEKIRPSILGACFSVLSHALMIYGDVNPPELERMGDFNKWGCAIARALGYKEKEFLEAYKKNVERQTAESLDASPLASVVREYFKTVKSFEGTATRLLEEFQKLYPKMNIDFRYLPQTPRQLGRKLREIKPSLIVIGYTIDLGRDTERWIKIIAPTSKTNVDNDETSSNNSGERRYDVNDVNSQTPTEGYPDIGSFVDFDESSF